MSSWYLTKKTSGTCDSSRVACYENNLRLQGFQKFKRFETLTHSVLFAYPEQSSNVLLFEREDRLSSDWIIGAGTLTYCALTGRKALERIYSEFEFPFQIPSTLHGQFALLVHKNNKLHVISDYSGSLQVFHDINWDSIGTSFLAICEVQKSLQLDDQGIYEYAISEFPLGDSTIFENVKRLSLDLQLRIDGDIDVHQFDPPAIADINHSPLNSLVEEHAETLLSQFSQIASVWGNNISCPLSGGLDSRLILACLRQSEVTPKVYVYGDPDSVDRRVAKLIGKGLGITIDEIDKSEWNADSFNCTPASINANYYEEDGIPIDSTALFDTGASSITRKMRHKDNALAISGGCGEVYRNFFYMQDKPYLAKDVVTTFFCRFHIKQLTKKFSEIDYIKNIAEKMNQSIGSSFGEFLDRQQVEFLYSRFRCRSFFGREISIESKHANYMMPFIDKKIVDFALTIPMSLKNAGIFESALLKYIDPELAAFESSYGHNFLGKPSTLHRISELSTSARPKQLRKMSYAIKQSILKRKQSRKDTWMKSDQVATVIDTSYPYMKPYFEIDHIRDIDFQRRIANLEYICGKLGGKLQ